MGILRNKERSMNRFPTSGWKKEQNFNNRVIDFPSSRGYTLGKTAVFEHFVQKNLVVCKVFSNFAHAIGTVHFFKVSLS